MANSNALGFETPTEHVSTLANLLELALYAPIEEITPKGRAAMQRAAMIVANQIEPKEGENVSSADIEE
jgi:hypothetical protein